MANQKHAEHFMVSVLEVLSSHTAVIKNMDEENRAVTERMTKLANENEALTRVVEQMVTNNKVLTDKVEKLADKNEALAGKMDKLTNENKALTGTMAFSKRLLLHSDSDILGVVTAHDTQIQQLQTDVSALKSDMSKGGPAGSTYVRWGRNNCSGCVLGVCGWVMVL